MSALLDTHTFAWFFLGDERLPETVRGLIAYDADVFVSAISGYEMALKHRLGSWPESRLLVDRFEGLCAQAHFRVLDISARHAIRAGLLATVHRDPFDRIIAAQAGAEGLRVVSKDRQLEALGAEVVWG